MKVNSLIIRLSCALILTIFASSCTTGPSYSINVSSLSNLQPNNHSRYTIIPLDDRVDSSDLQFQEYARYVKHTLPPSAGHYVDPDDDPDVVVILGYGLGDPTDQISSFSIPQYGQTGVSSARTHGTLSSYGSYGTYSSTTTYTPTYGITGSTTHVRSSRTYQRHIGLYAYNVQSTESEPKQIWQSVITSRGSNNDLRSVFPVMLAAAAPIIATNSGESVTFSIKEDDERVLNLKRAAQ